MGNMVFLAFDADSAGRKVGGAILSDSPEQLFDVSQKIQHGNDVIFDWANNWGAKCYSSGGDQGLFAITSEALDEVEQIRKDYEFATGLTVSIGIGNTLSESGKSLLVAKFKGKNQTVTYDPSIEDAIVAAQNRVAQGNASEEERKLGEAYLKPKEEEMDKSNETADCQYCQEMGEDPDHCQHCHDLETDQDCQYCKEAQNDPEQDHEHTGDDCQYCREAEESAQEDHTHADEESEADCQYCQQAGQEEQAEGEEGSPEGQSSPHVSDPDPETQQPGDDSMAAPAIEKPDINDGTAPGIAPNNDMPSPENDKLNEEPTNEALAARSGNIYNQDEESEEAMRNVLSAIDDGSDSSGDEMNNIDVEQTPVDGDMEENVSRPDSFANGFPSDMGLAEDEVPEDNPDISEVLQGGLDDHANNIQREKIVQMVGEALDEFKGCKQILEKAKEQAPQLYSASIKMLKAMIGMAEELGLAGESEEQQVNEIASDDQGINQEVANDPSLNDPKADPNGYPDQREPAHFQHPNSHAPGKDDTPPKKEIAQ